MNDENPKRYDTLIPASRASQILLEDSAHIRAAFRALMEGVVDGVAITNKDREVVLVNRILADMLQVELDRIIGRPMSNTVIIEDEGGNQIAAHERPLYHALNSARHLSNVAPFWCVRKNGTRFPVVLNISPIVVDGEVVGTIEIMKDITKEVAVEQAKTGFVSLASHQLRTPLSIINWYSEMLLGGEVGTLNSDQKKYLAEIYGANQKMVELVNALLNVSRIETGSFVIDPKSLDIAEISREVVRELEPSIFERKLDVREQYGTDVPLLNVDKNLMKIIFQNLVSNAIKYTPKEGRIDISVFKRRDGVLITVKDDGYGIPALQEYRIFEKMFRADNVKALDTEGTGLGLYLVKSILDFAGGDIWFTSKEGKGTSFQVMIPLDGMRNKGGTKPLQSSH